jgi:prephenate dehydrogenase
MANEGLMDWDAEIATEPVLQLFVVQHDEAVPAVDEPVLVAVHVEPDATHEYVLVAVPANHTEEVLQ